MNKIENVGYIDKVQSLDKSAYRSIVDWFKMHNITELNMSADNNDGLTTYSYCYNDDGITMENIIIDKIVFENDELLFNEANGTTHNRHDFHPGSMPYIHYAVKSILENMELPTAVEKDYEVYLYYHGCFSVVVQATSEEEAYQKAILEEEKLSELDFYKAIELQTNGHDINLLDN